MVSTSERTITLIFTDDEAESIISELQDFYGSYVEDVQHYPKLIELKNILTLEYAN